MEAHLLEQLRPIFPNLTDDIIRISIQHPSNNGNSSINIVFQNCLDDLLELRTYTELSTENDAKQSRETVDTMYIDSDDDDSIISAALDLERKSDIPKQSSRSKAYGEDQNSVISEDRETDSLSIIKSTPDVMVSTVTHPQQSLDKLSNTEKHFMTKRDPVTVDSSESSNDSLPDPCLTVHPLATTSSATSNPALPNIVIPKVCSSFLEKKAGVTDEAVKSMTKDPLSKAKSDFSSEDLPSLSQRSSSTVKPSAYLKNQSPQRKSSDLVNLPYSSKEKIDEANKKSFSQITNSVIPHPTPKINQSATSVLKEISPTSPQRISIPSVSHNNQKPQRDSSPHNLTASKSNLFSGSESLKKSETVIKPALFSPTEIPNFHIGGKEALIKPATFSPAKIKISPIATASSVEIRTYTKPAIFLPHKENYSLTKEDHTVMRTLNEHQTTVAQDLFGTRNASAGLKLDWHKKDKPVSNVFLSPKIQQNKELNNNPVISTVINASLNSAKLQGSSQNTTSLVKAQVQGSSQNVASSVKAQVQGSSQNVASLVKAQVQGSSQNVASLVNPQLQSSSQKAASLINVQLQGSSQKSASLINAHPESLAENAVSLALARSKSSLHRAASLVNPFLSTPVKHDAVKKDIHTDISNKEACRNKDTTKKCTLTDLTEEEQLYKKDILSSSGKVMGIIMDAKKQVSEMEQNPAREHMYRERQNLKIHKNVMERDELCKKARNTSETALNPQKRRDDISQAPLFGQGNLGNKDEAFYIPTVEHEVTVDSSSDGGLKNKADRTVISVSSAESDIDLTVEDNSVINVDPPPYVGTGDNDILDLSTDNGVNDYIDLSTPKFDHPEVLPPVLPKLEKSPEEKMDDQISDVLALFPDMDPLYIRQQLLMDSRPEAVNNLCNYLLENTNYPRIKKPVSSTVASTVTSKNFSSKNFYEDYSAPVTNYRYKFQCEALLQSEFQWISVKDIRMLCEFYHGHYAPMHRALSIILKKGLNNLQKSTGGKSNDTRKTLSRAHIKCEIPVGSEMKKVEVICLKCPRYRNSAISMEPDLEEEYRFVEWRKHEDAKDEDFKIAQELNECEYEEEGQLIECGCCYGEVPFENMVQCSEGHLFCKDCLKNYAQESVFGHGKASLLCMTDGCDATFPNSQLGKALPSNILTKYEDRVKEESLNLADLDDLVRCPHCEFAALLDPNDKVFKCQNSTCLKETCRYCKESWDEHFGKRCEEIEKKDEVSLRVQYEEKMAMAKIRQCHRCKARFMKEEGCNKMTCKCGATMCYICREPNIDYKHFCQHLREPKQPCDKCDDCFLWSKAEEDDERAIAEIRKESEAARKQKGYLENKLIGAPDEPPSKKMKVK